MERRSIRQDINTLLKAARIRDGSQPRSVLLYIQGINGYSASHLRRSTRSDRMKDIKSIWLSTERFTIDNPQICHNLINLVPSFRTLYNPWYFASTGIWEALL